MLPFRQEDSYRGRCSTAGPLPPWLKGTLYRAGPGLWEVGERQLRHLSDGAMKGLFRAEFFFASCCA